MRSVVLSAVLLLALVSLGLAFPWGFDAPLAARQIGVPEPNDFVNYNKPGNLTEYDVDAWTLSTSRMIQNAYQVQPYVANGYHGSRLTAEGLGFWRIHNTTGNVWPINGWPLDNPRQTVATISGFWDSQRNTTRTNFAELLEKGGESVIAGIPTWSSFVVATPDGQVYEPGVSPAEVLDYRQTLSLKDGIVTTEVTWKPDPDGPSYDLRFTVVAHRSRVNLGLVKIDIAASEDSELIVTDILDGQGAQRTKFVDKAIEENDDMIWTSVQPNGIDDVTAYEFSTVEFVMSPTQGLVVDGSRKNGNFRPWVSGNDSTISQDYTLELSANSTVSIVKYVGIASTDAFPDDTKNIARNAALHAKESGWDDLIGEHQQAWQDLWDDADVEIPGPEDLEQMQISIRASLFHLLSNVRSGNEGKGLGDNSIAVGGLSSDSYAGLIFWDADLWMMPGLLALHPEHAAAISNYRYRLLPMAVDNAEANNLPGAIYPWTSSRFGNCTATGPCVDYQYHVNSDIALMHWHQFLTTGDLDWLEKQGWPIISSVAEMFAGLVKKSNASGENGLQAGMYTISNMTDPDEYANHVDNGAFTSGSVKVIMGIAQAAAKLVGAVPPSQWADIERNMFVPYNTNASIIPEFSGMNGSVEIKQADVVLLNYPLEFRLNQTEALNDLDFYARAQSPDGPAMTWAMFAIDALELSPHGCASWTYSLYASQPYLRQPYYQFSEQIIDNIYVNGNTNPAFTFLTGHGGFLQISTHGYTGYRPRYDAFYLDPSIPPQMENGITIKGMKHQGASFDVHVGLTNTTINRRTGTANNEAITVRIADANTMKGNYSLLPGGSLVVPTRRPDLNGTDIPGNQAQCVTTYSTTDYVPGQFPISAVDGSNHTTWRPSTPNPSELILDLGEITSIKTLSMNWAKYPPLKWTVYATDSSPAAGKWTEVYHADSVEISDPWSEETALDVVMKIGNTTVVKVDGDYSGRWIKLVVEGDREGEGKGPTVAQLAILSDNDGDVDE